MDFYRTDLTDDWATIRGPARILVADEDQDIPTGIQNVIDLDTFDAQDGWTDVGATKGGATIDYGLGSPQYGINRDTGQIDYYVNEAELTVSTRIAENTFESYQLAWHATDMSLNVYGQRVYNLGTPDRLACKRICLAYREKSTEFIRLYCIHRAVITPSGSIDFQKAGDQLTIPINITAFPDFSNAQIDHRFMKIIEQFVGVDDEGMALYGLGIYGVSTYG